MNFLPVLVVVSSALAGAILVSHVPIASTRETELRVQTVERTLPGNKISRAATGAAVGGGIGTLAWLALGTIGIATGGVGIGVGLLGLTAGGAIVGGTIGTATGDGERSVMVNEARPVEVIRSTFVPAPLGGTIGLAAGIGLIAVIRRRMEGGPPAPPA